MSRKDQSTSGEMEEKKVSLYVSSKKIYPRSVKGIFTTWRWVFVYLTQLVFYGLPWIEWGGRQAVLFDISSRQFYLFGIILVPQDLIYLSALLIISALALFLFTAVAGRLWCGYSCPQTVYTEIFLWIEQLVEGDRAKRMRLDDAPMSAKKLSIKSTKHAIWILFSLWTGFTFVGYFTAIQPLFLDVFAGTAGLWSYFWIAFYGFATYGNAGFLREQICKYMCPYARFQSAMFDHDTLIITYDAERGEPRGARSSKIALAETGLGSCIDCKLCVQVCPTGIDIRNGLQYECIGCGACIDACDEIMDNMNYPRGLIRMTTQNALDEKWDSKKVIRRIFRPRVLIYSAILWAIIFGVATTLVTKDPIKVNIQRDRGVIVRYTQTGDIENIYKIHLINTTEKKIDVDLSVSGLEGMDIQLKKVSLEPLGSADVNTSVTYPYSKRQVGTHSMILHAKSADGSFDIQEKTVFTME